MRLLLEQVVRHEINRLQVKEKMTGHLVKRKRRGTYQALSESDSAEKNIEEILLEYLENWMVQDILSGDINKKIKKELKTQLIMELSRRGFDSVIKEIFNPTAP